MSGLSDYLGGSSVPADPYSAYRLRRESPLDQGVQDRLGPLEHEQFMAEVTARSPLLGTLLAAGLPVYTVLKMMGIPVGGTGEMLTSRPSLEEMMAGWRGYGRGMKR